MAKVVMNTEQSTIMVGSVGFRASYSYVSNKVLIEVLKCFPFFVPQ